MLKFPNITKYRTDRVYRVIVSFEGGYSTGSGFFIGKNVFLTCFHVAFTKELRQLRMDPLFKGINNSDENKGDRPLCFIGTYLVICFNDHIGRRI